MTRMATQAAKIEGGMVRLPESAPWLMKFEGEVFKFPLSITKDQIDSLSQALKWAADNGKPRYEYESIEDDEIEGF